MSKEDIIERSVRDYENKATSLYNNGYKEGKNEGYRMGKESGIKEAWQLVRDLEAMSYERFKSAFRGFESIWDVVNELDYEEVKHCLEDFAEDELKTVTVGDVVIDPNGLEAIVTNTDTAYHLYYPHNGKTWKAPKRTSLKKAGKRSIVALDILPF